MIKCHVWFAMLVEENHMAGPQGMFFLGRSVIFEMDCKHVCDTEFLQYMYWTVVAKDMTLIHHGQACAILQ
jgi:hypothetical protein